MKTDLLALFGLGHFRRLVWSDFKYPHDSAATWLVILMDLNLAYLAGTGEGDRLWDFYWMTTAVWACLYLIVLLLSAIIFFRSRRLAVGGYGFLFPNPITIWLWPILALSFGGLNLMYLQWMRPPTLENQVNDYIRSKG